MKLHSAIFYTNDLGRIAKFYRDTLHFPVDYIQEERFASFKIGNSRLGIKKAKEEREIPGHQTVFIGVSNIEEMYREVEDKKIKILKLLTHDDWATNFSILDPDGNKVQFVEER